jgi:hypothetical protein
MRTRVGIANIYWYIHIPSKNISSPAKGTITYSLKAQYKECKIDSIKAGGEEKVTRKASSEPRAA